MRFAIVGLLLALTPLKAFGETPDWGFIDPLLAQALDIRPGEGGAALFVDHGDPAVATFGLAFFYYGSRTGGNATYLNVGLFQRSDAGWTFVGPVNDLFGHGPRDAQFLPGRIEITTTTLGPGEPRCCPTQVTRWSVDLATRQALRLN